MTRTSDTHPLRIDAVSTPLGGLIGMTFCPGKKGIGLVMGAWERDLPKDFAAIREWGAEVLVTLMEDHEFDLLGVPEFSDLAREQPFAWVRMPIVDVQVPGLAFEIAWAVHGPSILETLRSGGKVALHCRGGLGRTGTVAARLLVELGAEPEEAIRRVREARPGAIETLAQETYVLDRAWEEGTDDR